MKGIREKMQTHQDSLTKPKAMASAREQKMCFINFEDD